MRPRRIGPVEVSPIGLGCASLSLDHADSRRRGVLAIRAALRAGITLFDTALAYTPMGRANHNERLLARALTGADARVLISTKGGHYRDGDAFPVDGRPATLRAHCEASLAALGVDRIGLYFLHWPDPDVPIEESVGALAELRRAGKIEQIGVSNVDRAHLDRARGAAPIAAVQNRLSVFDQRHTAMARHCAEAGLAFLAYSPLGGSGTLARREPPRRLAEIARAHERLPAQVALAWLLSLTPTVIPIVGASRPSHIRSAAEAADLSLTPPEWEALHEPAATGRTTIRIDHPRGDRWRTSVRGLPEVESTVTTGGNPPDWVQIVLRPRVDEQRIRSIVQTLATGLSAGSGEITLVTADS